MACYMVWPGGHDMVYGIAYRAWHDNFYVEIHGNFGLRQKWRGNEWKVLIYSNKELENKHSLNLDYFQAGKLYMEISSHGHLPHLIGLFQSGVLHYTFEKLNIHNAQFKLVSRLNSCGFFCNTDSHYTEENLLAGASRKISAFKTLSLCLIKRKKNVHWFTKHPKLKVGGVMIL